MADEKRLRYPGLRCVLSGAHDDTTTTFTFTSQLTHSGGTAVPTLAADEYLVLVFEPDSADTEIVYLTAYTSGATTGTVVRGCEGTVGTAHADTDVGYHSPTHRDFPPEPEDVWGGD